MPSPLAPSPMVYPVYEVDDVLEPPVNGGWCHRCQTTHALSSESAREDCLALMAQLRHHRRIDWSVPEAMADPRCSTESLFGTAGGKMFGILCCRDARGARKVLRAFSGQFNGLWQVDGWVQPIFDVAAFDALIRKPEQEIKRIGREIAVLPKGAARQRQYILERKTRSRQLMREIHALYCLVNFRGEEISLVKAFCGNGAPPSGTGDCCGPKLLHHAAINGLRPEGMAEFYWGRSNVSVTRVHGRFYPSCVAKCSQILGFQLCGL